MVTLPAAALQTFPAHIEKKALLRLLEETQARETLLRQTVRRLEQKYQCSLEPSSTS
jgi:DNA-binding transcriptional regulator PaaX